MGAMVDLPQVYDGKTHNTMLAIHRVKIDDPIIKIALDDLRPLLS